MHARNRSVHPTLAPLGPSATWALRRPALVRFAAGGVLAVVALPLLALQHPGGPLSGAALAVLAAYWLFTGRPVRTLCRAEPGAWLEIGDENIEWSELAEFTLAADAAELAGRPLAGYSLRARLVDGRTRQLATDDDPAVLLELSARLASPPSASSGTVSSMARGETGVPSSFPRLLAPVQVTWSGVSRPLESYLQGHESVGQASPEPLPAEERFHTHPEQRRILRVLAVAVALSVGAWSLTLAGTERPILAASWGTPLVVLFPLITVLFAIGTDHLHVESGPAGAVVRRRRLGLTRSERRFERGAGWRFCRAFAGGGVGHVVAVRMTERGLECWSTRVPAPERQALSGLLTRATE